MHLCPGVMAVTMLLARAESQLLMIMGGSCEPVQGERFVGDFEQTCCAVR